MFAPARIPAVVLVALALCAAPVHATRTYKWVDEDGVTHYTQHPPPQGEAQIIEPSIGVPTGTTEGNDTAGAEPDTDTAEAEDDEGPQTMEAYCRQLREQVELLASDSEVRIRQDDGTLAPLSGDARTRKRAEIAQRIDRDC
ncbi:MAG: DUF4124 domain-containing protein [Halofilum sp. (in: g-proteobacteria)]|nr:DUF4124 domain-containing protein [Halofilum sp. (in: g-proteobacteria)]